MFSLSACVPSGRFLPQYKDMHVGLIGDFEISVSLNVSVCGCLSIYFNPVVN